MHVTLNPAITGILGQQIATHSYYQDVGRIRRRISADIEAGVPVSIEASWCDLQGGEWGSMICALTYQPNGSFSHALKYTDDGLAISIGEQEGLAILSSLFDQSWIAELLVEAIP